MSFYDRAHNRQSHSQPVLLGGEKLVEQLFVHLTPNACAMIAHAQAHFAVAITSCANLYLALLSGVCRMASKALLTRLSRSLFVFPVFSLRLTQGDFCMSAIIGGNSWILADVLCKTVMLFGRPIDYTSETEGVGFEPTVGFPTLDFESSALNRTQPPFQPLDIVRVISGRAIVVA
jgi:hypothetical protein